MAGRDDVTEGGLPRGRPTLACGGAGSGKTLLAMEFIVRGVTEFNEPGVFMASEETAEDLAANVAPVGLPACGRSSPMPQRIHPWNRTSCPVPTWVGRRISCLTKPGSRPIQVEPAEQNRAAGSS